MEKQTKLKKSLAFAAVLLFMLLYTSCSKKDNAQVPENNDAKDDNAQEQCAEELPPTRVYDLNTDKPVPNLFGKEAEDACKQNDERFSPVYDAKTETCHLTVKEPTVQTIKNVSTLLRNCDIGIDKLKQENMTLKPYQKLDGICRTNTDQVYKAELTFINPIPFKQNIVDQCKKIENCSCDEDGNCTLLVHDHVLAEKGREFDILGRDAPKYFDLSNIRFVVTRTIKLDDNKYLVDLGRTPIKVIYDNVEILAKDDEFNRCRLKCFKDSRSLSAELQAFENHHALQGLKCVCK